MAARRCRSRAQRESELAAVARLYCQRETVDGVARILEISHGQVTYDLRILQQRWRAQADIDYPARRSLELARLDHLERVFWEAWERSQGTRQRSMARQVKRLIQQVRAGEEPDTGILQESSLTKEEHIGDPSYLMGVLACIDRRCRLLGLDEVPTDGTGSLAIREITVLMPAASGSPPALPEPGIAQDDIQDAHVIEGSQSP